MTQTNIYNQNNTVEFILAVIILIISTLVVLITLLSNIGSVK